MGKLEYKLAFGDERSLVHRTEAGFLDHAGRSGRPFSDISFSKGRHPVSKIGALHIGGMILSASAGTGLRMTSRPIRQLAIVIPISGEGTVTQGAHEHPIRSGNQIIRASYHTPLTVDVCRFSHVNINPDRSLLAGELAMLCPASEDVEACLAEAGTVVSEGAIAGIDYYRILRSLISLVDKAACDNRHLERIGLETLFTRCFAEIVLAQLGRTTSGRSKGLKTGVASIDAICDHIAANIGRPLTLPQME